MQARPTVWSTLTRSAPNRTYLINIATKSHAMFEPILLENMEFNAQVGVLGHELAHISDFSKRSFWGMLGILLGNLSPQYLDKMEYATDDRTVVRGLGHQLLAWSTHVSTASETYFKENPGLVSKALQNVMENERYMTPTTIQKRMSELEIYQDGP